MRGLCNSYLCSSVYNLSLFCIVIFSLSLLFSSLNLICVGMSFFGSFVLFCRDGIYHAWCFLSFLHLWLNTFYKFGEIPNYISSNISSAPFFFVSVILITHILVHFLLYHRSWIFCFMGIFSLSFFYLSVSVTAICIYMYLPHHSLASCEIAPLHVYSVWTLNNTLSFLSSQLLYYCHTFYFYIYYKHNTLLFLP